MHFADRPVLIVIKSYMGVGSGYVTGFAQLSSCQGSVNPFMKVSHPENIQTRSDVLDPFKTYRSIFSANVTKICTVFQQVYVDGTESWNASELMGFVFETAIDTSDLLGITVRGCFDLPPYVDINLGIHPESPEKDCWDFWVYSNYAITETISTYDVNEAFENRGCFKIDDYITLKPWGVEFSSLCLLTGLKLTVFVQRKAVSEIGCSSLNLQLQPQYSVSPGEGIIDTSLPCGSMRLNAHTMLYNVVLSKPVQLSNCCYLKLTWRVSRDFYHSAVKYITFEEMHNRKEDAKDKERELYHPVARYVVVQSYTWMSSHHNQTDNRAFPRNSSAYGFVDDATSNPSLLENHWTVDSSLLTLSASIVMLDSSFLAEPNDTLNISFRHYFVSKSKWSFGMQHQLVWDNMLCVDHSNTCYKATNLAVLA